MKIYIMRHGQAGMNAKTDEQRPLTEQGIEESIHMAGWLAPQLAGSLNLVIHSNYLRARQTWQAIAPVLPKALKVEESGDITPYGIRLSWQATSRSWRRSMTTSLWSATCRWWGIWSRVSARRQGPPCSRRPGWPASNGKMAKESCSGWKDRIQYGKS